MYKLVVEGKELFDEATGRFVYTKAQTFRLEHSLISISKWESKWHKPFLKEDGRTHEEELDYVRCMVIDQEPDEGTLHSLTNQQLKDVFSYVNDSMTATWFNERDKKPPSRKIITSELIYYWMVALQIPFSCEKWHLNRLLTLIKICNIENSPKKKQSKKEQMAERRSLNAARRQKYHTKG